MKPRYWAAAVAVALFPLASQGEAEDYTQWSHRMTITFSGYDRLELADFPVRVVFSERLPGFFYRDFLSGQNSDLRFTDSDGSTPLNFEIASWDTNGESAAWVRVPGFAAGGDYIWAYWGRAGVSAPPVATNRLTWSAGFAGVWHLDEVVSMGGVHRDSTPYEHDGMFEDNNADSDTAAAGIADGADRLAGNDDRITVFNAPEFNPTEALTLEAWVRSDPSTWNTHYAFVGKGYAYHLGGYGSTQLVFRVYSNGWQTTTYPLPLGFDISKWHHYAGRFDRSTGEIGLFVDGQPVGTPASWANPISGTNEGPLRIGNDDATYFLDGFLDEVRISTVARDTNWIWATWMSIANNSSLITYGVALGNRPVIYNEGGATNVTSDSAYLSARMYSQGINPATVSFYWGPADGGTNGSAWSNRTDLGTQPEGWQTTKITNLAEETTYYYRAFATNSAGGTWAPSSARFLTRPVFTNWAFRMKIAFTGYDRAESLSDFPALVTLDESLIGFSYAQFRSGQYDDLRFAESNGVAPLNHEVESWNTGGVSHVWVQVPQLAGTNSFIWAYWGRAGVGSPPYTSDGSTWDSHYVGVWHLKETAQNGEIQRDSSRYANHGVWIDADSSGYTGVDGAIDGADRHQPWDYLRVADAASLRPTERFTLEAWAKSDYWYWNAHRAFLGKKNSYQFGGYQSSTSLYFRVWAFNQYYDGTPPLPNVDLLQWHHYAGRYDTIEKRIRIYVDGSELPTSFTWERVLSSSTDPLYIGMDGEWSYAHDGYLDEVRISDVPRSADWIWATWMTAASNRQFAAFGPVSLNVPVVANRGASNIAVRAADVAGELLHTGAAPATVRIYWGPSDGGTNPAAWAGSTNLGARPPGVFSASLTNLAEETAYYYRSWATNAFGVAWASSSERFLTLPEFSNWTSRMRITFPLYDRPEVLTNFPVLVALDESLPGFVYRDFRSGLRDDLRFADSNGVTPLNYEVEAWNTGGVSHVWVQVPELSGTNDAIWAYWGRAGVAVPFYTTNGATWDSSFLGVWHLKEPVQNGETHYDSTSNANHGTFYDNNLSAFTGVPGVAGAADRLNGSWDYARIDSRDRLMPKPAVTLEAWAKSDYVYWNTHRAFLGKYRSYTLGGYSGTSNLWFRVWTSDGWRERQQAIPPPGFDLLRWHYYVGRYDTSDRALRVFADATELTNSMQYGTAEMTGGGNSWPVFIGTDGEWSYFHKGHLDEVRISEVARSSNWLWATWMTIASNRPFQAYAGGGAGPLVTNAGAVSIATDSAELRADLVSTGAASTVVAIYWGPSDGGTNATAWARTNELGVCTQGIVSAVATGLAEETGYWYRARASNAFGTAWAPRSTAFGTLPDFTKWARQAKITFSGYNQPETLTNFPALVLLSEDLLTFSYRDFLSGQRDDLRFAASDGVTPLNYEVERWNTGGVSYVWVQVPALSGPGDYIRLFWGRAGVAAPPCTTNGSTWDSGYVAVWHLSEAALNADYQFDSTTNVNHGVFQDANLSSVAGAEARVAGGDHFYGGDHVYVASRNPLMPARELTLEAWAKSDYDPWYYSSKDFISKYGSYQLGGNHNTRTIWFRIFSYDGWRDCSYVGPSDFDITQWRYCVGRFDIKEARMRVYVDGVEKATPYNWPGEMNNGRAEPLRLGWDTEWNHYLYGWLDEARISSVARSSNWLWACWMTVASNASFGAFSVVPGQALCVDNVAPTNIAAYSATLGANLAATGAAPAQVCIYWGVSDGGTNTAAWGNAAWLGYRDTGVTTTNLTTLDNDVAYYCRAYATNAFGHAWAPRTLSFRTSIDIASYTRRMKIVFTGYDGAETLTNFPALVTLSEGIGGFFFRDFLSGQWNDLRFSDETASRQLYYEVESWNSNGVSCVWVQVPALSGTNTAIWAYWGRPGMTAPAYTTNGQVWAAPYVGVWHMGEINARDASPYGHHGNAGSSVQTIAGIAGDANVFNANGYIQVPDSSDFDLTGDYTLSIWLYAYGRSGQHRPLMGTYSAGFMFNLWTDNRLAFWNERWPGNYVSISNFEWHHAAVTRRGGTGKFYVDGRPIETFGGGEISGGRALEFATGGPDWHGYWYDGILDEARIERVERSQNWLWAAYMNTASNALFTTFGAVQADRPSVHTAQGATNVGPTNALLSADLLSTGGAPTRVWFCWGPQDGGTNWAGWSQKLDLGMRDPSLVTTSLTGLASETLYYYSSLASNSFGTAWGGSASFWTRAYSPDWSHRMKIAFPGYTKGRALTNFPALVILGGHLAGFSYADFLSGTRDDLRFMASNGVTDLNYDVESWDTNGLSYVWVQVPLLASSNDYIWAYWRRNGLTAPACLTNGATWSEGYAAVWHLAERGGTLFDATARGRDGTPTNGVNQTRTGAVNGACGFDATDDRVLTKDIPLTNRLTVSAWMRRYANQSQGRWLAAKAYQASGENTFSLGCYDNNHRFYTRTAGAAKTLSGSAVTNGVWTHVAGTYDGAEMRHYVNGVTNVAPVAQTGDMLVDTQAVGLAADSNNGGASWTEFFGGEIDEVRISAVARSPDWIWAEWLNSASNAGFNSYALPLTERPVISDGGASNVTDSAATLYANLASTGAAPTDVWLYWGPADGGATPGAWARTNYFGTNNPALLSTNLAGLAEETTYYYRALASNSYGGRWAAASARFATRGTWANWSRRAKITFAGYNRPETLTNFPALVVLGRDIPGFQYSEFLSRPRGDLRFLASDGLTPLNHEVERWDTNGNSHVWVQVPALAGSDDFVWALWGRAGMSAPPCTTNGAAWDDRYAGVWHLSEAPANQGTYLDSTRNLNHGVFTDANTNGDTSAAGVAGLASRFYGDADFVSLPSTDKLSPAETLTVSAWARSDGLTWNTYYTFVCDPNSYWLGGYSGQSIRWKLRSGASTPELQHSPPTGTDITQWHYYVGLFNRASGEMRIFMDGAPVAATTLFTPLDRAAGPFRIGNDYSSSFFDGTLDEVRISDTARSTNWIWACWMTVASNRVLTAYAAVEGIAVPPDVVNGAASEIGSSSARVSAQLMATGSAPAAVWICWGPGDGGTNAAAWLHAEAFGASAPGTLSTGLTGLAEETVYYYRGVASNAHGVTWAPSAARFVTAPDSTNWARRMKITLAGYDRPETLTNFPALAVFSESLPGFRYADFQSGLRDDLRFTDSNGVTPLNYEIDTWDTGGSSWVWVQVPTVSSNRPWIWAYWGRAGMSAPAYTTNGATWDDRYGGVWHLDEAPANQGKHYDSTRFRSDGTFADANTNSETSARGVVGGANHLFGDDDRISIPSSDKLNPGEALTVSAWVKSDGSGWNTHLTFVCNNNAYWLGGYSGQRWLRWRLHSGNSWPDLYYQTPPADFDITQWHHYAGTFSRAAGELRIFVDGRPMVVSGLSTPLDRGTRPIQIGFDDSSSYLDGTIDEVRISDAARGSNWLWACWLTVASNAAFTGYGAVEAAALPPQIANTSATGIGITGARLNAQVVSTGSAPTTVSIYWGPVDRGTNAAAWAGTNNLGVCGEGIAGALVTGLQEEAACYYRGFASNACGMVWAPSSAGFSTLPRLTNWSYRMKVTFAGYDRAETLTNFPALVVFHERLPGFKYTDFRSGLRNDLRFADTNGVTPLNYEVDTWDTGSNSYVWVQVPGLATNKPYVWAYWGRAGVTAPPYTTNGAAWDTRYCAVWHLSEAPPNQGRHYDSTRYGHHGTFYDANTNSDTAGPGIVGRGDRFFGDDDRLVVPTTDKLSPVEAMTVSAWVKSDTATWSGRSSFCNNDNGFWFGGYESYKYCWMQIRSSGSVPYIYAWNGDYDITRWRYYVGQFSRAANAMRLYVDGVALTQVWGNVTWSLPMDRPTGPLRIGCDTRYNHYLDGTIDEVHVSDTAWSTNWIWASWLTVASNASFASYGTVEGKGIAPDIANGPVSDISTNSARLSALVVSTGSAPTTVAIYWGPTDGGTNAGAWSRTNNLGTCGQGTVTTQVTGLAEEGTYFFRCLATNRHGKVWAPSSARFMTWPEFSAWPSRMKIAFNGYDRPETLTNFPALVVFNRDLPGFKYTDFRSGQHDDLRFSGSDGATPLNFEVETWEAEGDSCVWVQVPELSTNDTFIWAYWGRTNAVAPSYTTNGAAWEDAYAGVWHLSEGALNQGTYRDSTRYRHHGIFTDANGNSEMGVPGMVGRANHLYGDDERISTPGSDKLSPADALTISAWVKSDPSTWNTHFAFVCNNSAYWLGGYSGNKYFWIRLHTGDQWPYLYGWSGDYDITKWHYYVGQYDRARSQMRLYLDGLPVAQSWGNTSWSTPVERSQGPVRIGNGIYSWDVYPLWNYYLDGTIDEVRISDVVRSSNWVWACYMTVASNHAFALYSPPESDTPTISNGEGASDVTFHSATLNAYLLSTGAAPASVTVFWGTWDGGTNPAAWQTPLDLGPRDAGPLSIGMPYLNEESDYYYRSCASNAHGVSWAETTEHFRTPTSLAPWLHRLMITFSYSRDTNLPPLGPLTNFPALVILNEGLPSFRYKQLLSAGSNDLRFLSGDKQKTLNYEMERWNTSGSSYLWVQVPELSTNNNFIWAYWGRGGVPPPACWTNGSTWDTNYVGVWHLNESIAHLGTHRDSTALRNHGTFYDTDGDSQTAVDGMIAGSVHLNGDNDRTDVLNQPRLNPTEAITVSAWARNDLEAYWNSYWAFAGKRDAYMLGGYYWYKQVRFYMYSAGWQSVYYDPPVITNWHYYAGRFDRPRGKFSLFFDGRSAGSGNWSSPLNGTDTGLLRLGSDDSGYYLDGYLDEVRISDTARSDDWIWATFMTVSSNSVFTSFRYLRPATVLSVW